MKLKFSNSKNYRIVGILLLLVTVLLSLKKINMESSKYVEVPEFEQKTSLDFIQITLKEKHYNKLKRKRNKALSKGVLETSDSDYVPAMISFNGINYKAEIRLKGDWTDHLVGEKWSFRVKLKDDKTILGMRKFSIHHPKTRGYINEWLYHKVIKEEGLIGLRYGFLEGAIHIKKENSSNFINKEVGIYAIEETFDKRTLENNKRKESVILKYNEDLWWNEVKKNIAISEPSGLKWFSFNKSVRYPITVFSESKVLQDTVMHSYFKVGKNLLKNAGRSIPISDAFDVKKLAMQNAILNLFGATHGNAIINLRFYYNPITSKLEPIAFDGNSGLKLKKYEHFNFGKKEKEDKQYFKELIYALDKVSKPEYLEVLFKDFEDEISFYKKTLKKEFYVNGFSIENLKYNQTIIKKELIQLQKAHNINIVDIETVELKINEEIQLPEIQFWINNNTSLTKTNSLYIQKPVYRITRKSPLKSSYTNINNIETISQKHYKTSIIVKKGDNSNFFGLRILGVYPNRVDAVFDLNKGEVKGVLHQGGFENELATITPLAKGWYKCTLSGKVNSESVKILFGSTNNKMNTRSWESKTTKNLDIYLLPSSLTFEELTER